MNEKLGTPVSAVTSQPEASRLPTRVEILALMKLELLLWVGCVAQIGRCAIYYPLKAQAMKEIFMGMKIELPSVTILLLGYSDLLVYYKILGIVIALALLVLLVYGAKVISDVAVVRRREGPISFAWYQLTTAGILAFVLICGIMVGNLLEYAYTAPLMRLVNAVD